MVVAACAGRPDDRSEAAEHTAATASDQHAQPSSETVFIAGLRLMNLSMPG